MAVAVYWRRGIYHADYSAYEAEVSEWQLEAHLGRWVRGPQRFAIY